MRMAAAAFLLALAACSPPSAPAAPAHGAASGSVGAGPVATTAFRLEADALLGRWSFDRSCGLYDLVFEANGSVSYFDYADASHVVSYAGRWTIGDHNRVVLSLHRLGGDGAPTGDAITYNLDVSEPVADDLIGQFGAQGGDMRAITAKRCPEEDRE